MPAIGGGNISAPGTPYDGLPIQTTLINLSRASQAGNPQATAAIKQLSALPQFQGIGWQGLLAMGLSIAGGTALAGALGGAGSAASGIGGQITGGTAGLGGAGAAGNAMEIPTIAGAGAGGAGVAGGGLFGLSANQTGLLNLGLAGLGGYLNNTTGARTGLQAPVIAPEFQGLAGVLRQRALERLQSPIDTSSLAAQGISGINDVYRGISQANKNNLTARGLATSPVAGVVDANTNLARGGQIASYLNQLPLIQQQLSNNDIAAGGDVLRFGTGSQTTLPGSALGGGLSNLAGMFGYLYQKRQNPFGGNV